MRYFKAIYVNTQEDMMTLDGHLAVMKHGIPSLDYDKTWEEDESIEPVSLQSTATNEWKGARIREFAGSCWTVKEKLDILQKRVKELGGTYSHRFCQAKGTKWWNIGNAGAWEQACKEAGVEYELVDAPFVRHVTSIRVFGLTMRGTKGGKVGLTNV